MKSSPRSERRSPTARSGCWFGFAVGLCLLFAVPPVATAGPAPGEAMIGTQLGAFEHRDNALRAAADRGGRWSMVLGPDLGGDGLHRVVTVFPPYGDQLGRPLPAHALAMKSGLDRLPANWNCSPGVIATGLTLVESQDSAGLWTESGDGSWRQTAVARVVEQGQVQVQPAAGCDGSGCPWWTVPAGAATPEQLPCGPRVQVATGLALSARERFEGWHPDVGDRVVPSASVRDVGGAADREFFGVWPRRQPRDEYIVPMEPEELDARLRWVELDLSGDVERPSPLRWRDRWLLPETAPTGFGVQVLAVHHPGAPPWEVAERLVDDLDALAILDATGSGPSGKPLAVLVVPRDLSSLDRASAEKLAVEVRETQPGAFVRELTPAQIRGLQWAASWELLARRGAATAGLEYGASLLGTVAVSIDYLQEDSIDLEVGGALHTRLVAGGRELRWNAEFTPGDCMGPALVDGRNGMEEVTHWWTATEEALAATSE